MEAFSITTPSNLQSQNPTPQPFGAYFYTKEVSAGRIRGELSIHQTEIKTDESIINALGLFFKPSHSQTEIPLGLAAAPISISPNLQNLNSIQKLKAFFKTLYKLRVLRHIDKYLRKNAHSILNVAESASSVPHLKAVMYNKGRIIHFQTGYPGYTLAHFIEELSEICEEKIPLPEKSLLLLSVFKTIFAMLDNLPRERHGDFHPTNILVSIHHEEPVANTDQPTYTPPDIKTYTIDIGSIQNLLSPNLKAGKWFYTKQDDLQNLFIHLERWWSPQLNKLLGITQLTRKKIMQMLEEQDKTTQQRVLSAAIQDYQLQRLNFILNKNLETNIQYEKGELEVLSQKIHKIYEIDEKGEGAPTVIMPYTTLAGF